jgi:hypothetical protein
MYPGGQSAISSLIRRDDRRYRCGSRSGVRHEIRFGNRAARFRSRAFSLRNITGIPIRLTRHNNPAHDKPRPL